ncbi:unnamed protein product [Rotaria sp. Silwood2]|nr:unnamed protein product [Rotaria sp. Silwood2]CAF2980147.1 unnamed protein product [Rotaria sp. Silwood2]CAF4016147.1 unnamed protein product [Rotaria sp. Silwood2]CAF4155272.1 unnamed protein product [Rotaria sp. Silwood2]
MSLLTGLPLVFTQEIEKKRTISSIALSCTFRSDHNQDSSIDHDHFFFRRVSTPLLTPRNAANNDQLSNPARRAASPPTDSSSSSISSSSENPRKAAFDFPLPTTMSPQQNVIKKTSDIVPPSLINFDDSSNSSDEQEEDGSASIFSNRNATTTALEHLKTIDTILQGNETPRTRTIPKKPSNNGTKDFPAEYEDESISHSVSHSIISSVDDITVDKASPSPSTNIDYLEDY